LNRSDRIELRAVAWSLATIVLVLRAWGANDFVLSWILCAAASVVFGSAFARWRFPTWSKYEERMQQVEANDALPDSGIARTLRISQRFRYRVLHPLMGFMILYMFPHGAVSAFGLLAFGGMLGYLMWLLRMQSHSSAVT
jgi:hypothetical protein